MNKLLTSCLIFITISMFAQNNGFKYQAIIRDAPGNVNANSSVNMEISILQGATDGTAVFTETHAVVSNTFGLVNLTIGSQNPTDFNLIDWTNGPYFIKIVADGVEFGTSQLLSVPYALHAKTAESVTETDPVFTESTASTITQTQIENWTNKLSDFAETDPDFNVSVAAGITPEQIESWTNKLDSFIESDPEFSASLSKGITAIDTAYWNSKLDEFVEADPTFLAHPASGITAEDITMWKALWIWYTTNQKGYLTAEVDGSVTNELQVLSISNDTIYLENGGFAKLPASNLSLDDAYNIGRTIVADSGALLISGLDGIESTGNLDNISGISHLEGNSTRMIWNPRKAAFRAGMAESNEWEDSKTGAFSFASGMNTIASGIFSFAHGWQSEATANYSIGMVAGKASASHAVAIGDGAKASGVQSLALGSADATGQRSTAIGNFQTIASGEYATAMGTFVEAKGKGSFFIGDASANYGNSEQEWYVEPNDNRFTARFDNGYYLFTRTDLSTGVFMNNSGIAWVFMSDKNKKENFKSVNGEEVLLKISQMNLTSWNIKGQDPNNDRHYGPMAQDFFAAFGNDGIGTVGNETSICTSDFDGINLIGIKALESRTRENTKLLNQFEIKTNELEETKKKLLKMEERIQKLENYLKLNTK